MKPLPSTDTVAASESDVTSASPSSRIGPGVCCSSTAFKEAGLTWARKVASKWAVTIGSERGRCAVAPSSQASSDPTGLVGGTGAASAAAPDGRAAIASAAAATSAAHDRPPLRVTARRITGRCARPRARG